MQPLQNLRVALKVNKDYGGDKIEWCRYWNVLGFESLEKKLEKTAGKFAFGDTPTLADAFINPQVGGSCPKFNIDITKFPVTNRVYNNFLELQGVKDARPENQPDYEDRSKPQP